MAIFPLLENEATVQVNDKTRLDGSKSFVTQNQSAISKIEISPLGVASGYINVTSDGWLDWCYAAASSYSPKVRITATAASATGVFTGSITIVSASADNLFSNDQDIKLHEPDILKWVQDGRASFLDVHRRSQTIILKWLDKEGYVNATGGGFTKAAIIDIEEVKQWSTYVALRLIFEGLSNATDDVFADKAKRYKGMEVDWRDKAILRIDEDGDGEVSVGEGVDPAYGYLARR